MKRTFLAPAPAIIIAFLMVFGISSRAGILIGSLSPVTTSTTNTPTFLTGAAYLTLPQITVSNNGLSMTNAYNGSFRWSFDGVNWFTNASPQFNPSSTNAGSTTILAQTVTVPIQVQMMATTNSANTSSIQLGVTTP